MREIITKKPFKEFKVNGEIFKIDMSPVTERRFQMLWPAISERLAKAVAAVEGVCDEIARTTENAAALDMEKRLERLAELAASHDDKVNEVMGCAEEVINLRLLDRPFDKIYELCYGDIGELANVIMTITEIIKEQGE